jgi:hypothetical protein
MIPSIANMQAIFLSGAPNAEYAQILFRAARQMLHERSSDQTFSVGRNFVFLKTAGDWKTIGSFKGIAFSGEIVNGISISSFEFVVDPRWASSDPDVIIKTNIPSEFLSALLDWLTHGSSTDEPDGALN